MGDFTNQDYYWSTGGIPPPNPQPNPYEDYQQLFNSQQLDFKSNEYYNQQYGTIPGFYNPNDYQIPKEPDDDDYGEPPLLEELEIYPDRILEKVLAVLNPLRSRSLADNAEYLTKDSDLAGPIFFCLSLAMLLLLAGKSQSFGYIYGFSIISCAFMYCLLSLMSSAEKVYSISIVGSILGYCLIPIVALSFLGVFFTLSGIFGISLAVFVVLWASFSASRLFVTISGDKQQQPLIMYPSALVYGVFVLLVLF